MPNQPPLKPEIELCQVLDSIWDGLLSVNRLGVVLEQFEEEGYRVHGPTWDAIQKFRTQTRNYGIEVADLYNEYHCDARTRVIGIEQLSEREHRRFEEGD